MIRDMKEVVSDTRDYQNKTFYWSKMYRNNSILIKEMVFHVLKYLHTDRFVIVCFTQI